MTRSAWIDRPLAWVERGGNLLPNPAVLFLALAVLVVIASDVAARSGVSVVHPGTGATVVPVSLLTLAGLHRILKETVTNFTGFAPLGTVLVALLGIGVAEASGLLGAAMRLLVLSSPRRLLVPVVVFAGVMSNVGSEIGYVLLVPLAGQMFAAAGRHPILGLAAAFAGVSGGYSANLLLGTIDPLLAGLTQEAARIVDPDLRVSPACNWWFMAASTFLVTGLGTFVTDRVVGPRLGSWTAEGPAEAMAPLSPEERRGLLCAGAAALGLLAVGLAGTVPARGFLRDPATGDLLHSPLMSGIVPLLFLCATTCGLAYGRAAGTVRTPEEAVRGMAKAMETLGGYLVLVFFAAQFVAYFNWTQLGIVVAVKGADALRASGLAGVPLLLAFVALSAFLNLFMGSASAKWALMAPVFVPMFLLLGYDPALTQAAYRIGDSCTNPISPMMSYFPLIVAFFQRYDRAAGIGTIVATMAPYSVVFVVGWSLLLAVWMVLGLPFGPS